MEMGRRLLLPGKEKKLRINGHTCRTNMEELPERMKPCEDKLAEDSA
jgi:hypothetical protein